MTVSAHIGDKMAANLASSPDFLAFSAAKCGDEAIAHL